VHIYIIMYKQNLINTLLLRKYLIKTVLFEKCNLRAFRSIQKRCVFVSTHEDNAFVEEYLNYGETFKNWEENENGRNPVLHLFRNYDKKKNSVYRIWSFTSINKKKVDFVYLPQISISCFSIPLLLTHSAGPIQPAPLLSGTRQLHSPGQSPVPCCNIASPHHTASYCARPRLLHTMLP